MLSGVFYSPSNAAHPPSAGPFLCVGACVCVCVCVCVCPCTPQSLACLNLLECGTNTGAFFGAPGYPESECMQHVRARTADNRARPRHRARPCDRLHQGSRSYRFALQSPPLCAGMLTSTSTFLMTIHTCNDDVACDGGMMLLLQHRDQMCISAILVNTVPINPSFPLDRFICQHHCLLSLAMDNRCDGSLVPM
jgi:hypothetical protein